MATETKFILCECCGQPKQAVVEVLVWQDAIGDFVKRYYCAWCFERAN